MFQFASVFDARRKQGVDECRLAYTGFTYIYVTV